MNFKIYGDIKTRVEELKKLDGEWAVFGSMRNDYKFNEKLSKKDVVKFEKLNNIKLPVEYRNFLINIGNGGVGIAYGIIGINIDEYNKALQTDFILTDDFYYDNKEEEIDNCKIYKKDCDMCRYNDKCIDGKLDEDNEYLIHKELGGSMRIIYEGGLYYKRLILNGPYRGEIWTEIKGQGLIRETKGFNELYMEWLNTNLESIKRVEKLVGEKVKYEIIKNDTKITAKNFNIPRAVVMFISDDIGADYLGYIVECEWELDEKLSIIYKEWLDGKFKKHVPKNQVKVRQNIRTRRKLTNEELLELRKTLIIPIGFLIIVIAIIVFTT